MRTLRRSSRRMRTLKPAWKDMLHCQGKISLSDGNHVFIVPSEPLNGCIVILIFYGAISMVEFFAPDHF